MPNDLGTLGGKLSVAAQGNNRNQVVGCSSLAGDTESHAFLWQNGVMQHLGTFPGDPDSAALGITNRGQQVIGVSGTFAVADACLPGPGESVRAVIWQNGVISDLNSLIPAGSGLQLLVPLRIDPVGHIAGFALQTSTGEVHGFVLTSAAPDSAIGVPTLPAQLGANPKVVIPESVRELLRQRLRFGRFGPRPMSPR